MLSKCWLPLIPLALVLTACASEGDDSESADEDVETDTAAISSFNPDSCTGKPLTEKALIARVPAGQTTTQLGGLTLRVRSRTCADGTGCTDWTKPKKANLTAKVELRVFRDPVTTLLRPMTILDFDSCAGDGAGGAISCLASSNGSNPGKQICGGFTPLRRPSGNECVGPVGSASNLYLAGSCMRFTGFAKKTESRSQWTEYDYAAVGAL